MIEISELIGKYGYEWMEFMKRCHPELTEQLQKSGTFEEIAKSVDNEAWEYRELLDSQYAKAHPRPTEEYEKIAAWETTRAFYTDSEVMQERVLVPRTAA